MLTYRHAQPTDAQLYRTWAIDYLTQPPAFDSASASLETFSAWFTDQLTNPDTLLLVFLDEAGKAVGQVRFERTPVADMPDEIVITVSVDAQQGIAGQLIQEGCAECRNAWDAVAIHAYIRPDNQAAIRAFEQAGFSFSGESGKFDRSGQEPPGLLYVTSQ